MALPELPEQRGCALRAAAKAELCDRLGVRPEKRVLFARLDVLDTPEREHVCSGAMTSQVPSVRLGTIRAPDVHVEHQDLLRPLGAHELHVPVLLEFERTYDIEERTKIRAAGGGLAHRLYPTTFREAHR
jgi:hypothetical protein